MVVVPWRACARVAVRTASSVPSMKSAPAPPWTWMSDEAGGDERSVDLERAGRRLHLSARPHGGDPPASTEHGTVLEQTVGPDDGAAKEHGAHTARLSQ
jgi:hypothetical protein